MRIATSHIVIAAAATALLLLALAPAFVTPGVPQGWQPRVVTVPRGAGGARIAALLAAAGVIDRPRYFRAVSSLRGANSRLKAGRYRFAYPLSAWEAVGQLASGAVVYNSVTVPEGFVMARIAGVLQAAVGVDSASFMSVCADSAFLASAGVPASSAEGYLFPSTYEIEWATPADRVAKLMLGHCLELFTPEWRSRMEADGRSLHQVITMASLVEAEAQVDSERVLVASVFYNRLRLRRPLESCASIEYILPRRKKTRLTYNDLKRPSPYNTYLNRGLPPGPVCSPGKRSLQAAVFPAKSDYLYFVSRGDGGHVFSRTLEEHIRAKNMIIRMRNRQE